MSPTLTIRLSQTQITILREIANARNESISATIRRMIDDGIKKEKRAKRRNKTYN